jgi:hypothetical protein
MGVVPPSDPPRPSPPRAERWALYHQATLLERAFRRTLSISHSTHDPGQVLPTTLAARPSASEGAGSGVAVDAGLLHRPKGGGPAPGGAPGPCVAHLGWSLPVVAQLLRCLHGLWAPDVLRALGPLQVLDGRAGGREVHWDGLCGKDLG